MGFDDDKDVHIDVDNSLNSLDPDKKIQQYKELGRQSEFELVLELLIDTFMPFSGSIHTHGDPSKDKGSTLIGTYTQLIKDYRVYIDEVQNPPPDPKP